MNYELALKLKESGWNFKGKILMPLKTDVKVVPSANGILFRDGDYWVYLPTLSELIEACGEYNNGSGFKLSLQYIESGSKWWAEIFDFEWLKTQVSGFTPEEAVAYLWLELNKK